MRAGLSTIQQTLTPEAAGVLNQSISEAGRRNHGQTTPLHVAATLLASSSGYLRQACIRSHPNSSHPLQCRALELCFSVALDRLPSAQNASPSPEPPISNALMAALKRAQAHQRRGCPEQQQQPLLAVKVELEQLIISILDDPSVSRVMREASFSSPAVKATIEQSLNSANSVSSSTPTIGSSGLGFRPGQMTQMASRNSYMNPRLQQGNSDQSGGQRRDDVKKLVDILLRNKKRNPVLVGETEPELVVKELLQRIERKEVTEILLRNVQVVSLEKEFGSDRSQIPMKLKELERIIYDRIGSNHGSGGGAGVILYLGDLKWLVEQPAGFSGSGSGQAQQQIVSETGRVVVADIGKLLSRFREGHDRLWMIGTATCETYLRCQVYHPSMENDWDLQAVPIAARTPLPGFFPRMGGGILSSSVESLLPLKNFPTMITPISRPESRDPVRKAKCCPLCMQNYEQDLAQLKKEDSKKSSVEAKTEATKQPLPQWLQIAKPDSAADARTRSPSQSKDEETMWKLKTEELQKKWNDICSGLHPSFHQKMLPERNASTAFSPNSPYNSRLLSNQAFQPKLQSIRNLGGPLRMNQNLVPERPAVRVVTPLQSPIGTDLALGHPKILEGTTDKTQPEPIVRDFIGCIPSEPEERFLESKKDKLANILDPDSFKSLFKGLAEKVSWQNEAASAVAATVIQCRSGNSRRSGFGWKGDTWLLFAGPDRVGKKKMAAALSELLCRSSPVTICLGSRSDDNEGADTNIRGKTTLDRIAEAVQRNPSSVIVLEDFDQADMLLSGSIKRAFDRGRLPDSHGREISLKNVIFILTADGHDLPNRVPVYEDKLANLSHRGWQLHLSVTTKCRKRCADWLQDNRPAKSRTDAGSILSFDLNEAATVEDDRAEGSLNSSDLTVEHDHEHNPISSQSPIIAIPRELLSCVDEAIVFKPVDFGPLKAKVANTIATKFSSIIREQLPIEVDTEALEHVVGGVWFGKTEFDEWTEKVLVPSFQKLKNTLSSSVRPDENNTIAKLISVRDSEKRDSGDLLPNKITVSADEESSR